MTTIQKNLILTTITFMLILLSAACQSATDKEIIQPDLKEDEQNTPIQETLPNDLNDTDPSKDIGLENGSPNETIVQEKQRFEVNPHNYMIKAVDHEEDNFVLLTFDDAPTAKATSDILETLDKYNAKAIFFVNGHYAQPNLETLKEIAKRGHIIGNHTWWHKYLRQEDPETVREEIVSLNDFIEEHLGVRPTYFRPPFGQNSEVSLAVIAEEGMQTMNWSNGSLDWELKTADAIIEQVITNLKPGDNILFHDKQITADALDEILKQITEQGYRFVLPTEVIVSSE